MFAHVFSGVLDGNLYKILTKIFMENTKNAGKPTCADDFMRGLITLEYKTKRPPQALC